MSHQTPPATVSDGFLRFCWEHNDFTCVECLQCTSIRLVADSMPTLESEAKAMLDEAEDKILGLMELKTAFEQTPTRAVFTHPDGIIAFTSTHYPQYPTHEIALDGPTFHGTVLTIPGRGIAPDQFTKSGKTLALIQVRRAFAVQPGSTYHRAGDIPEIDDLVDWLDNHPVIWADKYGQKARSYGTYRLFVHPTVQKKQLNY